jgi:RimJ/RimL family protein N-acetyltransferase
MPAVTYRPATLDDAELTSDLMTAAYPAMTHDPKMLRYRWKHPRREYSYGRFIAERDEKPIGALGWVHGPWTKLPDRHCEVEVWLAQDELERDLLEAMFSWIGDRAEAEGSHLLLAYCGEDEPEMLDALGALGYSRERVEKVWELDLRTQGNRLKAEAAEARREMSARGIEVTTLNEWGGSEKMRELYDLDARTRQDIPTTLPILTEAYEDFVRRTQSPDRRADRTWVAVSGDRPVGMTYLKFPPVRGTVWTGYTCTHPDFRGRGIARAIKLQSLAQAAELGIPVVRTDNDSENAPMLHINERLGYVRRPGFVEHHKRVRTKTNA